MEKLLNKAVEPAINAKEAGKILNCSERTVKRMAERKEIPFFMIGPRYKFRASALDLWMQKQLESACHP